MDRIDLFLGETGGSGRFGLTLWVAARCSKTENALPNGFLCCLLREQ